MNRAQTVFPSLAGMDSTRLSLHVMGRDQLIRIPKMAWAEVLLDLDKYEVIHVEVDDDAPPRYHAGSFHLHAMARRPRSDSRGRGFLGWAKGLFFRSRTDSHSSARPT